MKFFPKKLTPENLENFYSYQQHRNFCKLKRDIYEFMLSKDFISNKNRGLEISQLNCSKDLIIKVMEELKNLGWETELALHETYLFIYPPNQKPKMLSNIFEEF
jgi:hypothetical protein